MLWDPFLYCINDSIQGNSETGNKVFVLPSKVAINSNCSKRAETGDTEKDLVRRRKELKKQDEADLKFLNNASKKGR